MGSFFCIVTGEDENTDCKKWWRMVDVLNVVRKIGCNQNGSVDI
jgi:hypothetical protein